MNISYRGSLPSVIGEPGDILGVIASDVIRLLGELKCHVIVCLGHPLYIFVDHPPRVPVCVRLRPGFGDVTSQLLVEDILTVAGRRPGRDE